MKKIIAFLFVLCCLTDELHSQVPYFADTPGDNTLYGYVSMKFRPGINAQETYTTFQYGLGNHLAIGTDISTSVDNWDSYDTVIIGYPIWWGIAAWPVDTFVKANDFNGKTVIPFCTSSSSGLGESGDLLEKEANGGNWLEGQHFRSNPSDSDINNWTDSLMQ